MKKVLIGILAASLVMVLAAVVGGHSNNNDGGGFQVNVPAMEVSLCDFEYFSAGFSSGTSFDLESGWCSGNFGIGGLNWDEGGPPALGDQLTIQGLGGGWNGGHFDIEGAFDLTLAGADFCCGSAKLGDTLDFWTWCTHVDDPDWEFVSVMPMVGVGVINYTDTFGYPFPNQTDGADGAIGVTLTTAYNGIGAFATEQVVYAIGSYDCDDDDGCKWW